MAKAKVEPNRRTAFDRGKYSMAMRVRHHVSPEGAAYVEQVIGAFGKPSWPPTPKQTAENVQRASERDYIEQVGRHNRMRGAISDCDWPLLLMLANAEQALAVRMNIPKDARPCDLCSPVQKCFGGPDCEYRET